MPWCRVATPALALFPVVVNVASLQLAAASMVAATVATGARAEAPQPVPIRNIGAVIASTSAPIGLVFGVKEFADGRLLVNDGGGRRLLLVSAMLGDAIVLSDSGGTGERNYGRIASPLIPYLGDSVLFLDFGSQSLMVLGPGGAIVRVMALPKASDLQRVRSSASAVDSRGRLVYRASIPFVTERTITATALVTSSLSSDSAALVRGDFETRVIDTVARVKIASGSRSRTMLSADGKVSFAQTINPLSWVDEWTIHADGSIAIVRGHDYHIDWITPDGTRTSSPKMPYDWRRLTDDEKRAMIDSVRRTQDSLAASGRGGYTLQEARASGGQPARILTAADGTQYVPVDIEIVPPEQIPDYRPPIRAGAVKADLEGNIWILPTTSAQSRKGGLVYDVVNRRGELYERVELPAGRSIAGFGRGVVFLMHGDRATGFHLEKAKVR